MSDSHAIGSDSADHESAEEHESHVGVYLKVFVTLAVLTAVEYFYARIFKDSFSVLVFGLMVLALVKAGMVGYYFMHLKFEGRWVFYMLVPACILAVVLVLGLYPDVTLHPGTDAPEGSDTEPVTSVGMGDHNQLAISGFFRKT